MKVKEEYVGELINPIRYFITPEAWHKITEIKNMSSYMAHSPNIARAIDLSVISILRQLHISNKIFEFDTSVDAHQKVEEMLKKLKDISIEQDVAGIENCFRQLVIMSVQPEEKKEIEIALESASINSEDKRKLKIALERLNEWNFNPEEIKPTETIDNIVKVCYNNIINKINLLSEIGCKCYVPIVFAKSGIFKAPLISDSLKLIGVKKIKWQNNVIINGWNQL